MFAGLRDELAGRRWLYAGLVATVFFAFFMEGVARLILGGPLKPAVLLCQVLGWDLEFLWLAEIIHYFSVIIVLPLIFLIFRRPLWWAGSVVAGLIWGALIWYGGAAHAAPSVGISPFYGGGNVMYASLAGHLIYGVVLGYLMPSIRGKA